MALGLLIIFIFQPKRILMPISLGIMIILILGNLSFLLPDIENLHIRGDFSFNDLYEIFKSIFVSSSTDAGTDLSLEGSRSHRLEMWSDIIKETVNENLYFGQGFGMDLTAQTFRHPHNSLISIFGRMGIVGLFLYLSLFVYILRKIYRKYRQTLYYKQIYLWFLFYVILSFQILNFSVVLESPMLAIPFYLILGGIIGFLDGSFEENNNLSNELSSKNN